MSKHVLLNNINHKDLKVINGHSDRFGDNVGSVLTFPTEFGDAQLEYPIFFQKKPDSEQFQSIVLLGLKQDENLFLEKHEQGQIWNARYIPAIIVRGPFLIGFQDQSSDGGDEKAAVIHVNMEDPRINETEGASVFLEHGGNSPYLEQVCSILDAIHQGTVVGDAMFTAFTEMDLIEPVSLEVELKNGEKYRLKGNYTISKEKLAALSGENLAKLNALGFLQNAFAVLASLKNMRKLIDIKNARL